VLKLTNEEDAVGNIFNVGSTEEISIIDLAEKIKTLTRSNSQIVYISYDKAYEQGFEDIKRRVPSIKKINRFIDFEPKMTLEETIKDIIEFEKKKLANGH
jgi:UDP-glucose 4-epimerase